MFFMYHRNNNTLKLYMCKLLMKGFYKIILYLRVIFILNDLHMS